MRCVTHFDSISIFPVIPIVIWGGLHGIYLVINHLWRGLWQKFRGDVAPSRVWRVFGVALTFVAVVVGWVFFRSANFSTGISMVKSMFGGNGIMLPTALSGALSGSWQTVFGISYGDVGILLTRPMEIFWIIGAMAFV